MFVVTAVVTTAAGISRLKNTPGTQSHHTSSLLVAAATAWREPLVWNKGIVDTSGTQSQQHVVVAVTAVRVRLELLV